jgi:ABC-2 type transport system permease protein
MKPLISLTTAAAKRYVRNYSALFFSMVIPIFLIVLFGFFSNSASRFSIGIYDQAKNQTSAMLINTIYCTNPVSCDKNNSDSTKNSPFSVNESNNLDDLEKLLRKGSLSAILIIPDGFDGNQKSELKLLKNEGKQQETGTIALILNQMTDNLFNINSQDKKVTIASENFESRNLGIIDFLIPGILGINVLSQGIFGVAFAFVSQKNSGTLKRLLATPITGRDIILAEGFTRVVISLLQVGIFVGLGAWFFNLKIQGNMFDVLFVCLLAIIVFLAIGFAIA